MAGDITIKFNCRKCGNLITWDDEAGDSTVVACDGCGTEMGTLGDLKKVAMDAADKKAREVIDDRLKDVFKRKR